MGDDDEENGGEHVRMMDTVEVFHVARKTSHRRRQVSRILCVLQFLLGLIEVILAGLWRHWFGIFIGISVCLFAMMAAYVTNTSIYYSSRVSRLKNLSLIANITLIGFCFLLVLVHIIGHGPNYLQGFPPYCAKLTNCARIAPTNPNFNSTIWPNPSQPLIIFGHDANSTADLFQGWLNVQTSFPQVLFQGQPNSTYQDMGIDLLYHVRFLSFFFGFPDDLFVTFNEIYLPPPLPNSLEGTQLWIQSNARIGSKDFGVNQERVESLVSFMIGFNLTSLSGSASF